MPTLTDADPAIPALPGWITKPHIATAMREFARAAILADRASRVQGEAAKLAEDVKRHANLVRSAACNWGSDDPETKRRWVALEAAIDCLTAPQAETLAVAETPTDDEERAEYAGYVEAHRRLLCDHDSTESEALMFSAGVSFGKSLAAAPTPTASIAAEAPVSAPDGFWLAPMDLDDEAHEAAEGQDDAFPLAGVRSWYAARDSWLARHPGASNSTASIAPKGVCVKCGGRDIPWGFGKCHCFKTTKGSDDREHDGADAQGAAQGSRSDASGSGKGAGAGENVGDEHRGSEAAAVGHSDYSLGDSVRLPDARAIQEAIDLTPAPEDRPVGGFAPSWRAAPKAEGEAVALKNLQTWLVCREIGNALRPELSTVQGWVEALSAITGVEVPAFLADARDNSKCKFAAGGACCVSHCGDPICLAEQLTTCNCRWKGDKLVQQCTLHEAWRDAIRDWSERAKTAEFSLGAAPVAQAAAGASEPMYLVMAGGDGFSSTIVPESKLDDAYLLTQWIDLECVKPDDRAEALEHFHEDDNWTHTDPSGSGERLEFSVHFEDGWVRVIRLFDVAALFPRPEASAPKADDMPGMWEPADVSGGETDCREATAVATKEKS